MLKFGPRYFAYKLVEYSSRLTFKSNFEKNKNLND